MPVEKTKKLVRGVGMNDAGYLVQPKTEGRQTVCPYYLKWSHMLDRCYVKNKRNAAYQFCIVCDQWLYFSCFRKWMKKQDWQGNELDKDILGNGVLYSPETCCFIPGWLNKAFCDQKKRRGKWPIGVSFNKPLGKFTANFSQEGKLTHLGVFEDSNVAYEAYLVAKKAYILGRLETCNDKRIKLAVLRKLEMM